MSSRVFYKAIQSCCRCNSGKLLPRSRFSSHHSFIRPVLSTAVGNLVRRHRSRFQFSRWWRFCPLTTSVGGFSLAFLGLFEKEEEVPIEEKVLLYIKKGILATQRGEFDLAEENFNLAFHFSKANGLVDALTQVLSYQANLALQRGKLETAEKLFRILMQRILGLKKSTQTDNVFVEISLKLADIMSQTGRIEEAVTGYRYCFVTQMNKIDAGENDEDTLLLGAWALHNLSQVYLRLGNAGQKDDPHFPIAVKCLKKAYSYVLQASGKDAQQAVAIKSDLATALALQGNLDDAYKIYNEIQPIAQENHAEMVPNIQISIASIHLQRSEFEEANKFCAAAKDLATQFKDMESFRRAGECITKSLNGKKKAEVNA